MFITSQDLIALALAVLTGGLIGIEREFRDKAAGFRTLIFICTGAALFTILSFKIGGENDPRIATNIVSGVGFLGAGVILREGGRVTGLTTAATIWVTAALGMGLGGGQYVLTGVAVVLLMVVLWVFPRFEEWIDLQREVCTYEVVCQLKSHQLSELEKTFTSGELRLQNQRQVKSGNDITYSWQATGSMKAHENLRDQLIQDPDVKEMRFW